MLIISPDQNCHQSITSVKRIPCFTWGNDCSNVSKLLTKPDKNTVITVERRLIIGTVEKAYKMTGYPMRIILSHLGIPSSTYYRWLHRASSGSLEDKKTSSKPGALPPIHQAVDSVCQLCTCSYALEYPQIGYKRLTWQMIDNDVVYLKAYQVYEILKEHNLLRRNKDRFSEVLKHPPEPDHPDEV